MTFNINSNPALPVSYSPSVEQTVRSAKQWATANDHYWRAENLTSGLPAGIYECSYTGDRGPILRALRVDTDSLLVLPDSASEAVVAECVAFWQLGDRFRALGFVHKRGFLLWGPPGSGKTATLNLIAQSVVRDHGGVVFAPSPVGYYGQCLQMVRAISPERKVLILIEDIDALAPANSPEENALLSLLDGTDNSDGTVFVATTNYPERLDKRMLDRPSRFDTVQFIGMPTAEARGVYLRARVPAMPEDERAMWVAATDGFSVAHLKELIVAVKCFGQPFGDALARLEGQHSNRPSSEGLGSRRVGFGNGAAA